MSRPSGNCPLCGVYRKQLQRDHIIPKHLGGLHEPSNFQYICANCHEDKTCEEARQRRLGRKASLETREKQRLAHLGKNMGPCSEERKEKMRLANKGQVPWNKGMKGKLDGRRRPRV